MNIMMLFKKAQLQNKNITKLIFGVVIVMSILAAFFLRQAGYISAEGIFTFLQNHRLLAPALFIAIYSILPSLFFPTLPLTIGAGFLWGPFWGVVFSITGATIGSSFSFLISRYLAAEYFRNRLNYSAWQWLLKQVDKNGWRVVAFTRVNPIFPSSLISYLFGVTSIPFLKYLWATFVFMLPPTIALAAFGSSIREFALVGNLKGIITSLLIAVIAFLLLFLLKPLIRKKLSV
jgi:uncharacterized membrane protein YdjX (TVP38/TMEM64 family)